VRCIYAGGPFSALQGDAAAVDAALSLFKEGSCMHDTVKILAKAGKAGLHLQQIKEQRDALLLGEGKAASTPMGTLSGAFSIAFGRTKTRGVFVRGERTGVYALRCLVRTTRPIRCNAAVLTVRYRGAGEVSLGRPRSLAAPSCL
jgi:hypothetical protein